MFERHDDGCDPKVWTLWDFKETPKISSYIYCLCGGEYEVIENTRPDMLTSMRIFVRNSKKSFVDADLVFRIVTSGMKYYAALFDHTFPFDKYDIIYCPEFRITAMENVGAITFTDRILMPDDELEDVIKTRHYHVHLHELAHMWFGDLTTMVWWNDLWLKESFADFCCAISFSEECYKEDPKTFNEVDLAWNEYYSLALEADLKPSTHPIA